jgi:oligopeptide/dipeptide ABC transporter ATP-binding protein
MRLLPSSARIESGSVQFGGLDLVGLGDRDLRKIRGSRIGRVPQDPLAALTPVITIGHQLRDVVRAHRRLEEADEHAAIVEILAALGMPDIEVKLRAYPYELSGGMRQRVLIAMALVNSPELVVADEPTTALDSTVQVQILELLKRAGSASNMSLILISHDIHVVSSICDRLVVMYSGQIVEDGPTATVLNEPLHPYTKLLAHASSTAPGSASYAAKGPRFVGAPPPGSCKYLSRCAESLSVCTTSPQLEELGGRRVRCFAASAGQGDKSDAGAEPGGVREEEPTP